MVDEAPLLDAWRQILLRLNRRHLFLHDCVMDVGLRLTRDACVRIMCKGVRLRLYLSIDLMNLRNIT